MKRDESDGLPVVGTRSKELGVRIPPDQSSDIDLEVDGSVRLNRRGMSVTSDWRQLLPHLIPKRLKHNVLGACGSDALSIYRMGEGEFIDSPINDNLQLALKPTKLHDGNIVPAYSMQIDHFLQHLADTRTEWAIDEPE